MLFKCLGEGGTKKLVKTDKCFNGIALQINNQELDRVLACYYKSIIAN